MKVAFIFPGQGAQYIGMGKELYDNFNIVKSIFDKADEILNEDFVNLIFNGTEEDIKKTENTQPGILMVSTAIAELLKEKGIAPVMTAGLSLGEYSALVAAGALSYEDALPLVRKRGQYMNEAVPAGKGTMAAVLGLDAEPLLACCEKASELGVVGIANYNCPGQLVISGEVAAVEKASELAKEAGARRVVPLQVSGPFHSSLLKPAGEKLAAELDKVTIKNPEIPVITNVEAQPAKDGEAIKKLLIDQVSHSVRWEDSVRYILSQGVDTFIEVGPGKALTGFMKKIDKTATVYNVEDMASLETVLSGLLAGMEA
jgi:[acyl-carrier-protein] S-malonyltransferase